MMIGLDIEARAASESTDAVRGRGAVPAIFYGPKQEATPIVIDGRRIESVWKQAGETTIITLKGVGEDKDTLIHDVQVHPVTGKLMHVDFYVIEKGKKVEIAVPLEFIGQAPAEKLGSVISKALHEIEIEVAPAELPHTLEVDLSLLKDFGDHIIVSQIKLPQSAVLKTDPDEIVASATAQQAEEAPTQPVVAEESEAPAGAAEAPKSE